MGNRGGDGGGWEVGAGVWGTYRRGLSLID